ncbi:putative pumilio/PUF RNA binding protein 9 [Trypanosoma grayi]|uniref:putative pumilio/PUF RNA binding protein 9 n=1 Tax=Trypanosoma grayi TaxID=71804 RepID=UPI0004F3FAA6|nr:putative pumilio/PUF RNA binding protein 9 [Trypanosoma grayi]KEG07034.1 putative pumilio/PUF RNA binding protein 9 [Trypanosoma grayi]
MEIREVNFNTAVPRGKSGIPMATYISPPRPNKQKHATPTPPQPSVIPSEPDTYMSSSASYPYTATADAKRMAEIAEANYAQCPCATCAHYRAYYAMQVAGCVPPPTTETYTTSATYMQDAYAQQQPPQQLPQQQQRPVTATSRRAVAPVVTVGLQRHAGRAASPAGDYHYYYNHNPQQQQPQEQQPSSRLYGEPTVSAPVAPGVMVPLDTADEFERKCVGRVAELACTAEGRSMLLAAMHSQDAAVIDTMVQEIAAEVETVALDTHGCHVLRALKDYMSAEQTALIVSSFTETLVLNLCTVSQYTRRILQALFERPLIDLQPIVNVLSANAQYLAATQQGCISLMRIFEQCDAEQKTQLVAPLVPLFAHIALDPFGNYVVQCAIEHSGKTVAAQYTVSCFTGELLNMSCNKYASNVVEKIIKVCGDVPAVRRLLMDELIFNPAALLQMVQDNFGNFVVQSIIENTDSPSELKRICDRLRPALPSSPYAAKVEAKIRTKHPSSQQQQQQQAPRQGSTRRAVQQQQQQQKQRHAAAPTDAYWIQ